MIAIPKKLFDKATACGLTCLASEQGNHCIQPKVNPASWCLTYRKGNWVLIVNGIPQILFRYDEALKFLDRFEGSSKHSQTVLNVRS